MFRSLTQNNGTAVGDGGTILRTSDAVTPGRSDKRNDKNSLRGLGLPTRIMNDLRIRICGTGNNSQNDRRGNTGLSRRHTRSRRCQRFLRVSFTMRTRGLLSATRASSSNNRWRHAVEQPASYHLSIFCMEFRLPMRTREQRLLRDPDGMILRTTNGGNTWVRQSSGIAIPCGTKLLRCALVNSNVGTIVGQEG